MSAGSPPDREGPDRRERRPSGVLGWLGWLLRTDHPSVAFVREVVGSVLAVLLLGFLLFSVSGIWPPMVAVESGSMEPHMYRGDLVFVMEEHRLAPSFAHADTGVVTYREARARDAYRKFGRYGDVVVFDTDGGRTTPVIHRARFWVESGENWVSEADPAYLPADSCDALPNCPAPHAGFITKGDNNARYDQVAGIAEPVRPAWIKGTAEFRIPLLGYVRLFFSEMRTGWVGPVAAPGASSVGVPVGT